jgi:hypothetical protein
MTPTPVLFAIFPLAILALGGLLVLLLLGWAIVRAVGGGGRAGREERERERTALQKAWNSLDTFEERITELETLLLQRAGRR